MSIARLVLRVGPDWPLLMVAACIAFLGGVAFGVIELTGIWIYLASRRRHKNLVSICMQPTRPKTNSQRGGRESVG
jgi:hypothetical protein